MPTRSASCVANLTAEDKESKSSATIRLLRGWASKVVWVIGDPDLLRGQRFSGNCMTSSRTWEPKGRLGWAAVKASVEKISPLAVLRPLKPGQYQLALPAQVLIGFAG